MLHSLSASSKTDFESPYIFFGELKSGLFHLSSDLSRVLGTDPSLPCRLEEVFDAQLADECDREVLRAHFEEFRRECASRDLFVRLRLERQVVWCRIRIIRMIIIPGKIRFQHIPVYHLIIRLLKGKEQQDSIPYIRLIRFLTSHFNEGIHIPGPNLGITATCIESLTDDRTCHTINLMKSRIIQYCLCQLLLRIRFCAGKKSRTPQKQYS